MTDPKLVIFDVDGTLVDSQAHILHAMKLAFEGGNLPLPQREEILGIVGLSLPQAMVRLAPDLTNADREGLVERYKDGFQAVRASGAASELYPGARELLEDLFTWDHVQLGVATGKSKRGLDHVFEALDLTRFFVTTQVADFHPSKPHPAMVLAALEETGVAPENAIMVGDTEFDIQMGQAAGVRTLAVSWGYHPASALTAADHLVDSFPALSGVLKEVWG